MKLPRTVTALPPTMRAVLPAPALSAKPLPGLPKTMPSAPRVTPVLISAAPLPPLDESFSFTEIVAPEYSPGPTRIESPATALVAAV